MIVWATTNGKTSMFKAGTLPLNMYRTSDWSDYPKDKDSCSPNTTSNTVEEKPATSATTVTPFISHEAIEDGQVAKEEEVEEEEEYDTLNWNLPCHCPR